MFTRSGLLAMYGLPYGSNPFFSSSVTLTSSSFELVAETVVYSSIAFMPFSQPERLRGSYDLFISYHPNDVAVAKGLADRLILAGKKVWFRPYERDRLSRAGSHWGDVMLKAIGGARWGLALVSEDYTATLDRQPRDFWELNGEAIFHRQLS